MEERRRTVRIHSIAGVLAAPHRSCPPSQRIKRKIGDRSGEPELGVSPIYWVTVVTRSKGSDHAALLFPNKRRRSSSSIKPVHP